MGLATANMQQNTFVCEVYIKLLYKSQKKKKQTSLGFISLNFRGKITFQAILILHKSIASKQVQSQGIITTSFLWNKVKTNSFSLKD